MSDADRPGSGPAGAGVDEATRAGSPGAEATSAGYEGSGGWGTAALTLLVVLFLISAALTVHSIVATFAA